VRPAKDQFWRSDSVQVRFQCNIRYIHYLGRGVKKLVFQVYWKVYFRGNPSKAKPLIHGDKTG